MLKSYNECAEFLEEIESLASSDQIHFPCIADYLIQLDENSFMKLIHPGIINGAGEQFCTLLQRFRSVRSEVLQCVS